MCGAMSDVFIRADNTVRNSNQDIVQFAFGDDGFDPSFCEYQSIYYQQVIRIPVFCHNKNRFYTKEYNLSKMFTNGRMKSC